MVAVYSGLSRPTKSSDGVFLIIRDPKWRFDSAQNGNFNQNKVTEGRNADKTEKKR